MPLLDRNEIHCFVKLKRSERKEETFHNLFKLAESSSAKDCTIHFGLYSVFFFVVTAINCFIAINSSLLDHHRYHRLHDVLVKSIVESSDLCIHARHSEIQFDYWLASPLN